jgi:hypothetical protein
MTAKTTRVIQVTAREGDELPEGGNTTTPEGALVVVKWAAPSLTETEAAAVRDFLFRNNVDTSPEAFAVAVGAVLGPDVEVRLPGHCDTITAMIEVTKEPSTFNAWKGAPLPSGVVPVLSAPLPSPSEVEAVTERAGAAAQAFVAHVVSAPPAEPFPWDAPAEGFGLDVSAFLGRIGSVPAGVECIPHDENRPDLVITVGPEGVTVKP